MHTRLPNSSRPKFQLWKLALVGLVLVTLLQSCYSVRIVTRDGIAEKKASSSEAGYYRDKPSYTVDTTLKFNVIQDDGHLVIPECPAGFYSVEYKVGLGNALLNMITFGKVKRVKVKYVCIKEEN